MINFQLIFLSFYREDQNLYSNEELILQAIKD